MGAAPKQDPAMKEAAMMSAQTGRDMLEWMKSEAAVTNQWAAEDRARDIEVFRPLQDKFIADAQTWDSPERIAAARSGAIADVKQSVAAAQDATARRMASMGVNPASGRSVDMNRRSAMDEGLATAGAANLAARDTRAQGEARRAAAIGYGAPLAINPLAAKAASTGATASGFQGQMAGYGQQANILNSEFQNRMDIYNTNMGTLGAIGGALGQAAGAGAFAFLSEEDAKEDKKKPSKEPLGAIRKMRVDEWTYKEGKGDGKTHVGPYAEEFAKETGVGDGKTINVIDALGVSMGAIKALDKKVDQIAKAVA